MRLSTLAWVLTGSVLSAPAVSAEPFTIAPDGGVVFNGGLTTSASFRCLQGLSAVCQGNGTSSLTFGSGADTSTFTFTGVETSVPIDNVATPVLLGSIAFTTTGAGFSFPTTLNPNVGVLLMSLTLTHTSPVPARRMLDWFFHPRGDETLALFRGDSFTSFPLGENPPGFGYTVGVYSFEPFPFRLEAGRSTDVMANVGAVPEPATLVLVGSAAAAALLRRRVRRTGSMDGARR
jgi:hypothetical protein